MLLGIALDLVTANVAIDYFVVHHPKVVESESPWVMALVWGVAASWWAGLLGGLALAIFNARLRPPVPTGDVLYMVAIACAVLWISMIVILAGIYGVFGFIPDLQRRTGFEHDRRLMAVAFTHMTEYFLAAGAVIIVALRMRRLSRSANSRITSAQVDL
jgi:hypothetical protein